MWHETPKGYPLYSVFYIYALDSGSLLHFLDSSFVYRSPLVLVHNVHGHYEETYVGLYRYTTKVVIEIVAILGSNQLTSMIRITGTMNAQTKCVSYLNQQLQKKENICLPVFMCVCVCVCAGGGMMEVSNGECYYVNLYSLTLLNLSQALNNDIKKWYFNLRLFASIVVSFLVLQNQPQGYRDYHVQQWQTCVCYNMQ